MVMHGTVTLKLRRSLKGSCNPHGEHSCISIFEACVKSEERNFRLGRWNIEDRKDRRIRKEDHTM